MNINELAKQEPEGKALLKVLESKGINDDYIAEALLHITKNAITHDAKGNAYEDFSTKLRAIQTLIKVKDKSFDKGGINLNFFQAPDINNLKY